MLRSTLIVASLPVASGLASLGSVAARRLAPRCALARLGPLLPPTPQGVRIADGAIEVELFVDLICPFSCRMLKAVDELIASGGAGGVGFTVHHVPQPWHAHSSYVHEAAICTALVNAAAYMPVVRALTAAYTAGRFTDEDTYEKSRAAIYAELLAVVASAADAPTAEAVGKMVALKEGGVPDSVQHIKWACKYHRARGIHVTPTVHVNGLEAVIVSSGWSSAQWAAFLAPKGSDHFTGSKLQ